MLYRFAENGRFGMINEKGNIFLKPTFLRLTDRAYEGYVVGYRNTIWSFINEDGKGVKHFNGLMALCKFSEGMAAVVKDGLVGYINNKFQMIGPCKYEGIMQSSFFREGLANVATPVEFKDRKYGFINKKGQEVIGLIFDFAHDFQESLCVVLMDNKSGAINQMGEYVIEPKYDWLNGSHEGKLFFCENDKWGVFNNKGEVLIEPKYEDIGDYDYRDFHGGFLRISKNKKQFFLDQHGNEIVDYLFDDALDFHEGFTGVKRNGKWSIINNQFEQITDFEYESVSECCEGFFGVQIDGKWGFINKKGEVVVKPIYESVKEFKDGLAEVSINGRDAFVNMKGEEIFRAAKPRGELPFEWYVY
jgi:hypothetical protein